MTTSAEDYYNRLAQDVVNCPQCHSHLDEALEDEAFHRAVTRRAILNLVSPVEIMARYLMARHEAGHPTKQEFVQRVKSERARREAAPCN